MTTGGIIAVVCSVIAAVASVTAIISFAINRSKDKFHDGANDSSIKGDIQYMRNSFDDLRLDVKEIARKQDDQAERLTRCEYDREKQLYRCTSLRIYFPLLPPF